MVEKDSHRIRSLRETLGLTQEEFARELGVSFTTVSRWENGHGKPSRLAQRQIQDLLIRYNVHAADNTRRIVR